MALQTVEEVSRRLKLTPAAIRMAIRHGRIPAVRFGRRLRVQDETVDALERIGLALFTKRERPQ